jgi:GNAT superfamily N-acetyltransferase
LVHKEKTEEYVILMSRLILHPEYRWRWLSSLLHRDFIKHVDTIQTDKSLYVSLYMHKQNVYALDIYKHWWYTYLCDSKDGLKYILDMKIR